MNAIVSQSPFEGEVVRPQQSEALVAVEQSRAVAEAQSAMIVAKKVPRDPRAAMDKILNACTRPTLAESALYTYSRGGTEISGPSIRLAEAVAQSWGNLQFGIRELEQRPGESTVEAFAWDVEANVRQVKVFQVKHERHTKKGSYALSDPRDVYELVANQGARRLRACILGVIPGDVIEAATNQCEVTLKTKAEVTPEALKAMLDKFSEFGVTKEQIEKRIQRHLDAMTPAQLVGLRKIYNSLKDGMSKPSEWFETAGDAAPQAKGNEGAKAAIRASARKPPSAPEEPDETAAILKIDSAANAEAAAEYLDTLRGTGIYAKATEAYNNRWAESV